MQPFSLDLLKPIFSSIISISVIYVIIKYVIGVTLISMTLMLPVFLLLYFFILLIMKGLGEDDLMIMRAIDERLGMNTAWIRKIIGRFS